MGPARYWRLINRDRHYAAASRRDLSSPGENSCGVFKMWAPIKSFFEYCQKVWGVEAPRWHYLQVEVTTRCNLPGCMMCPRTAWPERWQAQDLTWETFEALLPSLKFFSHVHLSGWGEPLLHPRLWDMARALWAQGLKVSLTTNGLGLNEEVQWRVLEHLDMVAISLDGGRAETYERLRPGADFHRLVQQLPPSAPASGPWDWSGRRWCCCF